MLNLDSMGAINAVTNFINDDNTELLHYYTGQKCVETVDAINGEDIVSMSSLGVVEINSEHIPLPLTDGCLLFKTAYDKMYQEKSGGETKNYTKFIEDWQ